MAAADITPPTGADPPDGQEFIVVLPPGHSSVVSQPAGPARAHLCRWDYGQGMYRMVAEGYVPNVVALAQQLWRGQRAIHMNAPASPAPGTKPPGWTPIPPPGWGPDIPLPATKPPDKPSDTRR